MRILMIGPGLKVRGGVSSVERLIVKAGGAAGLSVEHLSSYEDGGLLVKLLAFARCMALIPVKLLFGDYSLVHVHFSHYGSTLRKLILFHFLRVFRLPIVMHSHGSDFHIFFRGLPSPARWFVRYSLARAAQVIVLSESWRDFFIEELRLDPSRVLVMQNPVELLSASPARDGESVRYLFLGRLEKRKGIYDIVDALTQLKQSGDLEHAQFLAAGDGDVEEVKTLISSRGLQATVTVEGWVNRDRVVELLMQSHVLLLPSYNEGLPMALLEAMGCGMTVITSPVGGIPEVVRDGENGLLVDPGDVDALAVAMRESQEKPVRERLGNNAMVAMQGNSLDAYCERLFKNYASLCDMPTGVA